MPACPSCGTVILEGSKFCNECGVRLEAPPPREERKVITALFCDLVGSTALGERMDHEDVAHLLRRYHELCRGLLESHGGVVEKFIGDAVVGVFGVPAAHEDDPERAVRAALRIVEDVGASSLGIEVRIGVNTGEALVRLDVDPRSGEGFATGDTMNTAARLEAAAPVMGVAVGERTHRESAGRIAFEELPPISAKGKSEPVSAWRAIQPLARIGNPERDRTPFVGRDLELSMLTQLFERSRTRPSTEFVTIVADPGLGKSRLVRELARHVDAQPQLVVWREGRCLPYGDGISFWALGEIVKSHAGVLETDDQATVSGKLDGVLTEPDAQTRAWIKDRLAPLVGLQTDTAPPQQEEAFTAWRRFLESLATSGPTVLVIEDLHWADPGFVAFLEHLAERTAGLPLLVICTARPELEERHPSWPPGRRPTVLSLAPLGGSDLETLVSAALPEASPETIRIVLERAGGSPLYAEQLAAMLSERGLPISGGSVDESLIPASVQALIAARIDALPLELKRVLMEAAVVGKTFWAGAVAALGEHADLEITLGELVRREFCRPLHPSTMEADAEFGFWHALVRDVAYAELTKAERARMHTATARWITDRTPDAMGEDAEIVVHHLDAALELAPSAPELDTETLTELLIDALLAAGEAAFHTDATTADRLLKRAVDLLDGSSPRSLRAISLRGRSLMMAGRPADALPLLERTFEAMRRDRDFDDAAELAWTLGSAYWNTGRADDARKLEARLLEELGPDPSRAKASLLGGSSLNALELGPEEEAEANCAAGFAICDELGCPPPPQLMSARGFLRILRGDLDGATDVRRAVQLLLDLGRPDQAANTLWNLSVGVGEWIGVASTAIGEEAIALCSTRGVRGGDSYRVLHLLDLLVAGRWDDLTEAEELSERAREGGNRVDESCALLFPGYIELERAGSLTSSPRLMELVDAWEPSFWIASFGGALLARSDQPETRKVGLEVLDGIAETGADETWRFLHEEVRSAIEAGSPELARRLQPRPGRSRRPRNRADSEAATAAIAELDGRWEEASEGYRAAAETWEQLGSSAFAIGPLIGLGRCLLDLGRRDEGLVALKQARTIGEHLGANVRIAAIDELVSSAS